MRLIGNDHTFNNCAIGFKSNVARHARFEFARVDLYFFVLVAHFGVPVYKNFGTSQLILANY